MCEMRAGMPRHRWKWTRQETWKITKNDSIRYISQKKKAKESVFPLINEKREMTRTYMVKADIRSNFFASIFTGSLACFPCPSYPWTCRWVLGGQNPFHYKLSESLRPLDETEHVQTYRAYRHAFQSLEGIRWCSCQATLSYWKSQDICKMTSGFESATMALPRANWPIWWPSIME